MFADPRQSVIDIVQGVGRALRPFDGKKVGYAIIPTIIEEDGTPSDAAYDQVVRITCALGSENEVVLDYFATVAQGKPWTGRRVFEILGDVEVGIRVDLAKVNQAIAVRTYKRTVEWRPFPEAQAFSQSLGLRDVEDWQAYCRSGKKPADIPADPYRVYANNGWTGMGDWLGTGRTRDWRPFVEARAETRKLGIKNFKEWQVFCASGNRPAGIPSNPNDAYKHSGWVSWGDWLGTKRIANRRRKYLSYNDAKDRVHGLHLKNQGDWRVLCRVGKLPENIPKKPERAYRNSGWTNWGDWLGTGTVAPGLREYLQYNQAKAFVQALQLKSKTDWEAYCRSGRRSPDTPVHPERVYSNQWKGWGDWLGTGTIAPQRRKFLPHTEARAYIRKLGLKNQREWNIFRKSKKRPAFIPTNPHRVYRNDGWKGLRDWLGTD
jgi:hypothetical protein